jgi:hypothetical protein
MNSRSPTNIIGLYKHPKARTISEYERQHRRMVARDWLYRTHVYCC